MGPPPPTLTQAGAPVGGTAALGALVQPFSQAVSSKRLLLYM